jgi:hypothetical protein
VRRTILPLPLMTEAAADVFDSLHRRPMTAEDLVLDTGRPYSTVQTVLSRLLRQRLVERYMLRPPPLVAYRYRVAERVRCAVRRRARRAGGAR